MNSSFLSAFKVLDLNEGPKRRHKAEKKNCIVSPNIIFYMKMHVTTLVKHTYALNSMPLVCKAKPLLYISKIFFSDLTPVDTQTTLEYHSKPLFDLYMFKVL